MIVGTASPRQPRLPPVAAVVGSARVVALVVAQDGRLVAMPRCGCGLVRSPRALR